MSDYPSPRVLLERHGLSAKRSWGQNFLADPGIAERFAAAAELDPEDIVVELGAGLGHLTARLAERGGRVVAVERDRDLVRVLEAEFEDRPQVEVLAANAATLDLADFTRRHGRPVVVVGNLPYQITSPILFRLLDEWESLARAVLGVQREVADRLCASVGSRESGLLTVLLALRFERSSLFHIGPGAYTPRPRVASGVLRLTPFPAPAAEVPDEALFRQLVRAAFAQRRKTLRRALAADSTLLPDATSWIELLRAAGVDHGRRGETLSIEEFARIAAVAADARKPRGEG